MADRSVLVRLRADASQYKRELTGAAAATNAFVANLESADGRMANLVQTGLALAPALVPLGGLATTAVVGLANQLAFAAAGAGAAVLAFQGMGDALTALNDYALAPTSANLLKVEQAMAQLSPAGREFATFVNDDLRPGLERLQDVAAEGLFPGLQAGLVDMQRLAPQVESIISTIATTTGDIFAEAGDNLADPRWREFFAFLDSEARPTLTALGKTTGNFAEGLANLWMAFDPVSDDFSSAFLDMSRSFAEWTRGLESDRGFQDFIDYLRETGPQAVDTVQAIVEALASLVEAAAPVGRVLLPVIEGIANGLSSVAQSPVGPVLIGAAAGIGAIGRSLALLRAVGLRGDKGGLGGLLFGGTTRPIREGTSALLAVPTAADRARKSVTEFAAAEQKRSATIRAGLRSTAAAGAGIAGLAAITTGVAESAGLANTASLTLMGTLGGPWGTALGAAAGATLDAAAANDAFYQSANLVQQAIDRQDFSAAAQNFKATEDQFDAFRKKVTDPSLFTFDLAQGYARTKNLWEGLFGTSDVDEQAAKLRKLKDALGELEEQKVMDANLGRLRDEFSAATESAEDFAAALARVSDYLEGRSDIRDYQAALDDFTASLRENGRSFDIATGKGRNNQEALDNIAGTALKVADGLRGMARVRFLEGAARQIEDFGAKFDIPRAQTRGLTRELLRAAGIDIKTWVQLRGAEEARAKVRALGRQYGLTPKEVRTLINQPNIGAAKAQVDQLARKYHLTPKQVTTLIKLLGAASANAQIGGVAGNLRGLDGNQATVTILTRRITEISRRIGHTLGIDAEGSVTDFYGNGGMRESHVAQIAPAGSWRMWAEPETGGEAYIPLAAGKRARSLAIWEETGRRLGVQVARMQATPAARVTVDGSAMVTVRTPWGDYPAEVMMRQVARDEIAAERDFDARVRR